MSECPHEIWERESDVTADGSCPICLRAEIERLREQVTVARELRDCDLREIVRLQSAMHESSRMHVETQDLMQAEIDRLRATIAKQEIERMRRADLTDIVERLRAWNKDSYPHCWEAAREIERLTEEQRAVLKHVEELRAEIDRLRREMQRREQAEEAAADE